MPLQPGTRVGAYAIVSHIGSGGMGDVYRARDTTLNRDVAIKVLPDLVAADPERLARFEREARTLASLSHGNIAHIFGLEAFGERAEGRALVMELVKGESLDARLARGPLRLDEVCRYGAEIANALAAAHREGIVHRDLKPANVMVTASGVKLLDFGLAKRAAEAAGVASAAIETATSMTTPGLIMGTVRYMSPEQIGGLPLDGRTDIFALGVVLYEMATGQRAFQGDTTSAIIASILAADVPDITVSPALDRIVKGCVAKDRERRWHSAHDVALLLGALAPAVVAPPARSRQALLPWAIAAIAVLAAVLAAVWPRQAARVETAAAPIEFAVPPPSGSFVLGVEAILPVLSPDGSQLAFAAAGADGVPRLWVRRLDSGQPTPLPGTERGNNAFWSPDGRDVAFFAGGWLKRISVQGGAPVPISEVRHGIGQNGTWGADGQIRVASVEGEAIFALSTAGGALVKEVVPDPSRGETRVNWPIFLPDGRRYVYIARHPDESGRLMLHEPGRPPREIMAIASNVAYVDPGYLLYAQDGALFARAFDAATVQVSGDAFAVAPHVGYFASTGTAQFSASRNGTLALVSADDQSQLVSFDLTGHETGRVGPPGRYLSARFSPDGTRLAFTRANPASGTYDVWLSDPGRGVETRVTSDPGSEFSPVWRGPKQIVYSASRGRAPRLYLRDLDSGADRLLPSGGPGAGLEEATSVSADGTTVLYAERTPQRASDVFRMVLDGGAPEPVLSSAFSEQEARYSPDGRAIAFASDDTGVEEVYVMATGSAASHRPVSRGGGRNPCWSADGRRLFYLADDDRLMAVSVGPDLTLGTPAALFTTSPSWWDFDVARDGRFIAVVPRQFASKQPLTVVVNWPARLRR